MFCVFLYGPFCHGAHKLDLSTLFTTFFLWTSPPFILDVSSLKMLWVIFIIKSSSSINHLAQVSWHLPQTHILEGLPRKHRHLRVPYEHYLSEHILALVSHVSGNNSVIPYHVSVRHSHRPSAGSGRTFLLYTSRLTPVHALKLNPDIQLSWCVVLQEVKMFSMVFARCCCHTYHAELHEHVHLYWMVA